MRDLETWESSHNCSNRSVSLSHTRRAQEDFLLGPLSALLVSEEWHSWAISLQNRKWVQGQKWLGAGENITSPVPECFGGSFVAWHCVKHMWDSSPLHLRDQIHGALAAVPDSHPEKAAIVQASGDSTQTRDWRNQNCAVDLVITIRWMCLSVLQYECSVIEIY